MTDTPRDIRRAAKEIRELMPLADSLPRRCLMAMRLSLGTPYVRSTNGMFNAAVIAAYELSSPEEKALLVRELAVLKHLNVQLISTRRLHPGPTAVDAELVGLLALWETAQKEGPLP